MKKLTIILLLLVACSAIAQSIDEEKMNRDLEIAKNVLGTLLKGESVALYGSSITGSYVEGYGVILTIPEHYSMIHIRPPKPVAAPRVRVRTRNSGDEVIVYEENIKSYAEKAEQLAMKQEQLARKQEALTRKQEELSEEEEEELAEAMAEIEVNAEAIAEIAEEAEIQAFHWQEEFTRDVEASMQKTEQAIITFLADYADLIGQLKPNDHIMVKYDSPFDRMMVGWSDKDHVVGIDEGGSSSGFSAEVSKKVISDYKTGKISFDAFKEKVKIKRSEPERRSPDLDMFASIFRQYYGPKMSQTFFIERTPSYEILDNFGVIYTIRTYSSYEEGKYYYMPVLGKDKVSSEERKTVIEELYPKFENDLKSFIIDYGRTIRSLEDDDVLLLKIGMTRCEECSIPKSIDVSIKLSVLKQFDQQKISKDKAMAAIEIKKNFNSSSF
jgi:hypothetical protein